MSSARHPETMDLEYIGDPPILDDVAAMRIATGEVTSKGAAILRAAEQSRLKAITHVTRRIVDPASFGTSREYVFGPTEFVVAVDWEDGKKILASESGNQFRQTSDTALIIPRGGVAFADEYEVSKYDVYQR